MGGIMRLTEQQRTIIRATVAETFGAERMYGCLDQGWMTASEGETLIC